MSSSSGKGDPDFLDMVRASNGVQPDELDRSDGSSTRLMGEDLESPDEEDKRADGSPVEQARPPQLMYRAVSSPASSEPVDFQGLPPLPKPPALNRSHERSVSFDKNARTEDGPKHERKPSDLRRTKTIAVENVTAHAFELEAETNILKAIEEDAQARRHHRFTSDTSTILTGVPDDIVHNFSTETDFDPNASMSDAPRRQVDRTPLSPRSNRYGEDGVSSPRSQSRPLLERRDPRHRRLISVEDRLAGLTYAMQAQSGMNVFDVHQKQERERAGSSGDTLGRNAAMLLHNDDSFSVSNLSAGRHRLNTLELATVDEDANFTDDSAKKERANAISDGPGSPVDVEAQPTSGTESSSSDGQGPSRKGRRSTFFKGGNVLSGAREVISNDWEVWHSFFRPRRENVLKYVKNFFLYLIVPFVGVAAILFYVAGNPPVGRSADGSPGDFAAPSWWLLFCVRQLVTFSLALLAQMIVIDLLSVGTRVMLKIVGSLVTLLIVQSKGWPCVVFFWSMFDFLMLYGDHAFARHWGYMQDYVALFTDANPSGNVVGSTWNTRVLSIGLCVSVAVALKRFLIGLYLGRQTFGFYAEDLAKVMNKMYLIGEVGQLSKRLGKNGKNRHASFAGKDSGNRTEEFKSVIRSMTEHDDMSGSAGGSSSPRAGRGLERIDRNDPRTAHLLESDRNLLHKLLERWEEPDRRVNQAHQKISISSVLRFRNALAFIKDNYPFSYAFGLADNREACIESSQDVYERLTMDNPDDPYLHFETLALITLDEYGEVDEQKAKDLIKVFRPDRQGKLTALDFVKSVDVVYREFRLLQASIENSSQIDRAFESIFNIGFYAVIVTVILAALGLDPLAMFLSLSSVILAFAFMIGSASSKYFEGLLFILVRRPYGIGDMINVGNVERDGSFDGSPGWVVQHVTLFETIVTWLPTNEVASLSNGSLANSRIINWSRSPCAQFHIFMSFPIETKYETIELFEKAIEEYMKVRPREWLSLNGFRVNNVYTDKAHIQVIMVIQHRERWSNIGTILDSKANLTSYCHEVQKQLGMEYRMPSMPIEIRSIKMPGDFDVGHESSRRRSSNGNDASTTLEGSRQEVTQDEHVDQFRSMASTKYNILAGKGIRF